MNKPQLIFMEMRHDLNCLAIETQSGLDCTCKTIRSTELSQELWLKNIALCRKARRAAARAAEKAMRRAKS